MATPNGDRTRARGSVSADTVRRVHAQHRSIVRQLGELRRQLADEPGERVFDEKRAELARRLARLQSDLADHFEDEERVGFVPRALAGEPQLARRARAIASQHDLLRVELAKVMRLAEYAHCAWSEVRVRFETFHSSLEEHERRENELIEEAHLDDLGGGG